MFLCWFITEFSEFGVDTLEDVVYLVNVGGPGECVPWLCFTLGLAHGSCAF